MIEPWFFALWAVGAYLVGSVSVGDLVARAAKVDIRRLGTGNPGTANVLREMGRRSAAAVLVGDVVKGAASTVPLLIMGLPAWVGVLAAASLLGGHFFPVPWRSVGGTGLAAAMGTTVGMLPTGAAVAVAPAVLVVAFTRNAGLTGGVFFLVTGAAGGAIHSDWVGVAGVAIVGVAIVVKSWFQYRWLAGPLS